MLQRAATTRRIMRAGGGYASGARGDDVDDFRACHFFGTVCFTYFQHVTHARFGDKNRQPFTRAGAIAQTAKKASAAKKPVRRAVRRKHGGLHRIHVPVGQNERQHELQHRDVEGETLTVTSATLANPAQGTVVVNPDGSLGFVPTV